MTIAEIDRTYTPEDLLRMPDNAPDGTCRWTYCGEECEYRFLRNWGFFTTEFRIYLKVHPIAKVFLPALGYQCFDDVPLKVAKAGYNGDSFGSTEKASRSQSRLYADRARFGCQ